MGADVDEDRKVSAPRERRAALPSIAFFLTLAAGLALRILIVSGPGGRLEGDEAVVGLMARHFLEGEWSPFFWAQDYGGSQEVLVVTGAFAIFGSSTVLLKTVSIALHAFAAVLVWLVGRATVGEPTARYGAALFWVWPAVAVVTSTRERGYYEFALIAGLVLILLALRIDRQPDLVAVASFGFVAGLGWWATPQIVLVLIPVTLWLMFRQRLALLWKAPVAAVAALIGAIPWIVHNAGNDWPSLHVTSAPPGGAPNGYFEHLEGFVSQAFPASLGLKHVISDLWIFPVGLSWVVYVLVATFLIVIAIRSGRSARPLSLVFLMTPFLIALSPFSWFVVEPRYLYIVLPAFALLLVRGLKTESLQAVALVAATLLTVYGVVEWHDSIRIAEQEGLPDGGQPRDLGPLLTALEDGGIDRVFTDYWNAYRISFESRETIIASSTGHVRYQPHNDLVAADDNPAYVFVVGSDSEEAFKVALAGLGITSEEIAAGGFVIYVPMSKTLPQDLAAP